MESEKECVGREGDNGEREKKMKTLRVPTRYTSTYLQSVDGASATPPTRGK